MNKIGRVAIGVGIFLALGGIGTIDFTSYGTPTEAYYGLKVGLLTACLGGIVVIMGLLIGTARIVGEEDKNLPAWEKRRNERLLGR